MKNPRPDDDERTIEENRAAQPLLLPRVFRLVPILACFIWTQSFSDTNKPASKADKSAAFDEDFGFDASWAAEKKLIGLFRTEGLLMVGQTHTNNIENNLFMAGRPTTNGTMISVRWDATNKATVQYAYVHATYPQPAIYRLSASRNSPGFAVLISVAGKISADRLWTIKDALREFDATGTPVVKVKGDFTK